MEKTMKVFYLPVFVFFLVFGIACQKNDKATVVLQDTSIEKYPQTEKHTSNTNLAVTVTDNDVHIRNQPHLMEYFYRWGLLLLKVSSPEKLLSFGWSSHIHYSDY